MRNNPFKLSQHLENGFTLIEVMVAVVIFSIGLLGVAGLQTSGLKTTHQSYQRTVAITAARDMADRMRANMTGVRKSNSYSFSSAPSTDTDCTTSTCTYDKIASHDAFQWYKSLSDALTSTSASSVSCTDIKPGTPDLDPGSSCIITVRWDSERKGSTGTGCNPAVGTDYTCVQLRFIP